MIRKYSVADRTTALCLMKEFYNSQAVLHSVPSKYFENTLNQVESGSPYVSLYMICDNDNTVCGYGLLSHTYSNEAGGMTLWVEELYLVPSARGKSLGKQFLDFVAQQYQDYARLRLEVEPDNSNAQRLYAMKGYTQLPYLQYVKDKEM